MSRGLHRHAERLAAQDRILVVGGGMAGSLLTLVLARAGYGVTVVDPRRAPPSEFRNEKLGIEQIEQLSRLGVLSCFQEACWDEPENGAYPLKDCGARYDRWIERLRAAWPASVEFVEGKVDSVAASDQAQALVLTDGRRIEGRLVVLATGRGERLRAQLGMRRRELSARHSLCIGLSIRPRGALQARVVRGQPGDRIAYSTVFPIPGEVRINVFSYHRADEAMIRALRDHPLRGLAELVPAFAELLADAEIVRPLEIRSTDLYAIEGHVRPGVVLLGDAFHAPCPASGTGFTRILNDIERLAAVHIPAWLATDGMGADKIAQFYVDPVKRKLDRQSLRRSLRGRASTLGTTPYWRLHRRLADAKRAMLGWRPSAVQQRGQGGGQRREA